jgi:hypothetical protein
MNPFDIDLKSSTIEKFIDVVASAIGKLSAPYLLKKMAEAKGQEILRIAESIEKTRQMIGEDFEVRYEADGLQISPTKREALPPHPDFQRIDCRLRAIEQERQKNLDNITIYGLLESSKITESSKEGIDRDWLNQFINVSQDISSDQMQEVWGKILAREVCNPGSFSLRSLEVLRTISKHEANIFSQLVQFIVTVGDSKYIFGKHTIYNSKGEGWHDYNCLREVGLFTPGIFGVTFHVSSQFSLIFRYGNLAFEVQAPKDAEFHLTAYPLSTVGKELAKLIPITPSQDYFDMVREEVSKNKGIECRII